MPIRKNDSASGRKPPEEKPQWQRDFGLMAVVTWNLVLYVGAGGGLGWAASRFIGAPAWVMVPGALFGLWLAMMQLFRLFRGPKTPNGESE